MAESVWMRSSGTGGGSERSRKGELALKTKYGRGHFVRMGQLGRRPTWQEELEQAKAPECEAKAKGGRRSKSSGG